jgi:hypothetical protein
MRAQREHCDPRARGNGVEVLDHATAQVDLVRKGCVEGVEQQHIRRAGNRIPRSIVERVGRWIRRRRGDLESVGGTVLFKDGDLLLAAVLEDVKVGGPEVVNGIALIVDHDVDENEVGVGAEERNRVRRVLRCRWRVSRWRRCLSLD